LQLFFVGTGGRYVDIDQVRKAIKLMGMLPSRHSVSKSEDINDNRNTITLIIDGVKAFLMSALGSLFNSNVEEKELSIGVENKSDDKGDYTSYYIETMLCKKPKSIGLLTYKRIFII